MQGGRYSKDHMKIPAYRQVTFQFVYPNELPGILTPIAVSVSAGIVCYPLMIAFVAPFCMTTHGCCSTSANGCKSFDLVWT